MAGAWSVLFGLLLLGVFVGRSKKRRWQVAGVGVLAVAAVGVAGFALLRPLEPAAPSIDVGRAEAVQEKFLADQKAEAARVLAANQPIIVTRPQGRPLSVLFAGDSLTVGRDASSVETSFRGLVTKKLTAGGLVEPVRIGDSGKTVAEVKPEMDVVQGASDIVVVELGTNDVYETSPSVFADNYPAFLAQARKSSPKAALICVGVWQSSPTGAAMDAVIDSACQQAGGRFVSLSLIHANPPMRSSPGVPHFAGGKTDGAHPNDLGHSEIATAVLGKITLRG
jgi:lysophospholipase L1-like esterase